MPSLSESTSQETVDKLEAVLLNKAGNVSLHNRFRALFTLKAIGDERAVKAISSGECTDASYKSVADHNSVRIWRRVGPAEARARVLPRPDEERSCPTDLGAGPWRLNGGLHGTARGMSELSEFSNALV